MNDPVFDAAQFVRFNLSTGAIRSANDENLALIPLDVIASVTPSHTLLRAAQKWGALHGATLAEKIKKSSIPMTIEALANHLGGTVAVFGLGRLTVEIRGDALMFRAQLAEDKFLPAGLRAVLGEFIAGYLSALYPKRFEVLPMGEDRRDQLYWASSGPAVNRVRRWIRDGVDPLAAVERLAEGGDA